MRAVVAIALAFALAGCATTKPQPPVHRTRIHHFGGGLHRLRHHRHHTAVRHAEPAKPSKAEHPAPAPVDKATEQKVESQVAAKLGNPASIHFQDVVAGKAAGAYCGVAAVKDGAGEREMPFVVQNDDVFIINGSDDGKAAAALRAMCD